MINPLYIAVSLAMGYVFSVSPPVPPVKQNLVFSADK
jgi:hypothetical protein